MRCREEGKLLARAGSGFNHPEGTKRMRGPVSSAVNSLVMQKRTVALFVGFLFHSAPIRVREKRMNTHKTAKALESYQKVRK
jgi:hypothetical protein